LLHPGTDRASRTASTATEAGDGRKVQIKVQGFGRRLIQWDEQSIFPEKLGNQLG
jgi:hypothetical protein